MIIGQGSTTETLSTDGVQELLARALQPMPLDGKKVLVIKHALVGVGSPTVLHNGGTGEPAFCESLKLRRICEERTISPHRVDGRVSPRKRSSSTEAVMQENGGLHRR